MDAGLRYLASLQKAEGIWPVVPMRRMPPDTRVSAFVLHQLGDNAAFRATVRFADAVRWFDRNCDTLDPESRRLSQLASARCRRPVCTIAPDDLRDRATDRDRFPCKDARARFAGRPNPGAPPSVRA